MDNILVTLLSIAFVAVCLFMMLVILIQKPKGGGLSGAFGGAGGGSAQAAFGAKTGDVLTWFTVICFTLFVLLAMSLVWATHPQKSPDEVDPYDALFRSSVPMGPATTPAAVDSPDTGAGITAPPADDADATATPEPPQGAAASPVDPATPDEHEQADETADDAGR